MDKAKLQAYRDWVRSELESSANFWLKNGMDRKYGGVYTCLDRKGEIYSTDKSVWMQGRCGWMFSHLCSVYGSRPEWLEAARSCLDFLEDHCINHAAGGRMYFTVTEDGRPLRQRRYYFSEAFYAMANGEYYSVTGEREHLFDAKITAAVPDFSSRWLMEGKTECPTEVRIGDRRYARPHRPWPQDHPRDPHRPGLRHAHDHPERHQHPDAGGPGAQGPLRGAGRPVRG